MQTAVSVKAGVAFLAGVALALGGAVTYFKVADARAQAQSQPVAKLAASVSGPDLTATPKVDVPLAPDPAPVETPAAAVAAPVAATPVVATPIVAPPKVVHPKLVLPKPKVSSRPVSLAVATPPRQLPEPIVPVPTPAPVPLAPVETPAPTPEPPQAQTPQPPPPQPHVVTLPAGTNLSVRLNEKISTDHNYSGDTFRATLDTPVVVDGFIIADRGAKVLGRIVKAQKPGKMQGSAELSLTLTEISTTDGQRMQVATNESLRKGPSNTNDEVMKMGGGAALGAIIGAIAGGGKGAAIGAGAGGAAGTGAVLLGHGKPAVLDNETKLTFTLANPTTLTEKLN